VQVINFEKHETRQMKMNIKRSTMHAIHASDID